MDETMQDSYLSSKTISLIKLWLFTLLLNIKLILFYKNLLYIWFTLKKTHEKSIYLLLILVFASFDFKWANNNFRKITNTENGQITIIGESFERNQIKCWQDFSEKLNKYDLCDSNF
jgi:hypothetical protein